MGARSIFKTKSTLFIYEQKKVSKNQKRKKIDRRILRVLLRLNILQESTGRESRAYTQRKCVKMFNTRPTAKN